MKGFSQGRIAVFWSGQAYNQCYVVSVVVFPQKCRFAVKFALKSVGLRLSSNKCKGKSAIYVMGLLLLISFAINFQGKNIIYTFLKLLSTLVQ